MKARNHAERFLRRLNAHDVRVVMSIVNTPDWALPMRELCWVILEFWTVASCAPDTGKPARTRVIFAPWGMVGKVG